MALDPLLLLPPEGADARFWAPAMTGLGMERMVMVAPVHLGDRIEEMASEIVTSAPPKFALCGAGLGGMVAMEVMRRAPERVSRLALLDTSPHAGTPDEAADREALVIKVKTGQLMPSFEGELRAAGLAPVPQAAEVMALALDMVDHIGPDCYARQMRCLMRRKDQQATLRRIKCPVMVACGSGNLRYPVKRHQSMAELIPYAELEVIEGAGHLAPLEQPEAVITMLRRWQSQPLVLR
ncbi:alpha/beta fold hydrolase [Primorskyibacter sp. S187A]|uniref:alpha/beta fold hydrolase n=1 Tax=Primorskyibacter sp. S187A TaxID=3415130 RepID=UPI003C7B6005